MELFVNFSEIIQFFKRHLIQFAVVVIFFGLLSGVLQLKFLKREYSASTSLLISCDIPEDAGTDYRLQYTNILSSRVLSGLAMASGTDLIEQTADKLGIDKTDISNIAAVQLNNAPVIKLTVTSSDVDKVSTISDTAAQVLGERLAASFPYPKLTASISDKAIPAEPQSNKSALAKAALLGFIIGFLLYIVYGIIVVLTDKTVRDGDFVSEALGTSFLGDITKQGSEEKRLDSFRKLRAAAVHQAGGGKSFLVADVCMNNGSAAVAAGFGEAIARANKNVLLIDADAYGHQVAKLLGIQPKHSLSEVLDGVCTAEQAIEASGKKGLSLIAGAEQKTEDFSDILATDRFNDPMKELSSQYDYIVVNVPSEARFSDADNLAPLFGAVILTAKYGSTPYREFKDSFRRLKTAGGNMIGFVTTDC